MYIVKIFREKDLYKVSELAKKEPKVFWSSVKSLLRDTFNKEQNSIHPGKPYFRSLLNNVNIDSNKLKKEREKLKSLEIGMANKIGELDFELKEKEILYAIKTLKNNKSKFVQFLMKC